MELTHNLDNRYLNIKIITQRYQLYRSAGMLIIDDKREMIALNILNRNLLDIAIVFQVVFRKIIKYLSEGILLRYFL